MNGSQATSTAVEEPFPVFTLAHKYLIYDPNVITHVRQKHNMGGVFIGSLPQAPQQNIFLGAPLELMPEEARLLVEKGAAYLVDDVKAHKQNFLDNGLPAEEKRAFQEALRRQGNAAATEVTKRSEDRKKVALKQKAEKAPVGDWNDIPDDMLRPSTGPRKKSGTESAETLVDEAKIQKTEDDETEVSLFSADTTRPSSTAKSAVGVVPFAITPTTSQPPLKYNQPQDDQILPLPKVSASYPLFKHLHEKSYFMSPGLRFGCQYTAYPGDPLRFHSHFLCSGMDWNQEFDLLDLVGGGRLGTGVKKGYLIGGQVQNNDNHDKSNDDVRTFCIEWAGI